ncbi:type 1 glutamine amidotransferase family protein [Schlesneria paludicola]|uniref:hypothetical protein n=1 Tax=Schlesneria paludicola TaxID=360056 RepID=UPI00029A6D5C|nr:hypothetical protein [Schlesneria paludicola]
MPSFFLRNRIQHPSQSRLNVLGLVVLAILGWCPLGACQSEQTGTVDQSTLKREFQFSVQFASESGTSAYIPEKWGSLRIHLMNARSAPRELLCSTYFDQDASLQYGRHVWVPAQSVLRTEHPVLIPKCDRTKGRNLEVHSLIFDASTPNETLVRSDGGILRHDAAVLVTHESRNTAIIGKPTLVAVTEPIDSEIAEARKRLVDDPQAEITDLVAACRVGLKMNNRITMLGEAFLPANDSDLDGLDQIVVADDRIVNDFAATAALRQWVNAGGHLWIMLDRVSPVVLEMLLGDDFTGYVVDRVGLTSVRIDEAPSLSDPAGAIGETNTHDNPVELVRMVAPDANVTHQVNGWPAAITMTRGDGKVLITTLGARGWMKKQPDGAVRPTDPLMLSDYKPTESMTNIADDFFRLRSPELLRSEAIAPQVHEYIGYSILSWWLIVGTLLAFSAGIVAIGIWLMRRGQLEQLVWFGSALALAVSLFLIQAGRMNRQGIPATIASVQLIQTIRGTDQLRTNGLLSTYQPEGSEFPIETTHGGRMLPDMTGLEQTSRRMVTTDLGVNHWDNLPQPPGVRSATFEHSQSDADRMAAYITFDAHGVSGTYRGSLPPGTDPILATRDGRLGLTMNSDGTFVGRGDDVFENGQYLSASLLSDEQDRRRRTLKELLDNPKRPDYPGLPQLMFWTGPKDNGFRFGEGLKAQGASLVAVPLVIERPVNGTQIMIPSPLLSYDNRRSPDGTQASAMWNPMKHEWQERSTPGLVWLSFQIPRALMPVVSKRAQIDLKVTGPIGRVELMGLKEGNVVNLKSIVNPVGSLTIEITDPEALTIDSQGRLSLGLSAGHSDQAVPAGNSTDNPQTDGTVPNMNKNAKANYWRIESLSLQLWAETTEPNTKD